MRRLFVWLTGCGVAGLISAPAVLAQGDGVTIDPDSPTAREYALPLEDVRRRSDPAQDPGAPIVNGERGAPAFGEGIVPAPAPAPASGAGAGEPDRRERSGERPSRPADPGERPRTGASRSARAAIRSAVTRPGAPDGGVGALVLIGGATLAVLAVGGLSGVLLRRRTGRDG